MITCPVMEELTQLHNEDWLLPAAAAAACSYFA
jgi:hypothetical protein